jgi:phosphoglycerol transferase MdoB-like AlkP superfamily enzyme
MKISKSLDFKQEFGRLFRCIFPLFALNFAIYSLIRVVFYVWNIDRLGNIGWSDLLKVFAQGLRFDLAVIFPILLATYLIFLIRPQSVSKILFGVIVLIHTVVLCGNFVDSELVNFIGRRFTKSTLYLVGEGQITNLMKYLWMTLITFTSLSLYLFFNFKFYLRWIRNKFHFQTNFIFLLMMIVLTILFGRGGLQEKPISFVDAKIIDHPFAHQMVLNTTFSALKSFGQKSFERIHFFNEEKMFSELNRNSSLWSQSQIPDFKNKNLVIFILESFSSEYISKENTPFFLKLAADGAYFNKSYANGRRSVEGIASILAGVPALMEEPFLNSEFATNDFVGLGNLFKKKKYHTSFFHGAKNGSMRFDLFARAAGFDYYYGLNEFPDKSKNDGAWGIWDEDFLNWSCDQTTAFQQPFVTAIFTLTSHHPFNIPDHLKPQFGHSNSHPVIQSIKYTDYALKQYFECAQTKPWFKDTLFLFVADHTGPSLDINAGFKSKYEIPILFYSSGKKLNLSTDQFAQQIDLLPTLNDLFDLGLLDSNHLARSLYQPGQKTIALYSDQFYELVGDTDLSDEKLKAIRQYYSQGLFDNRLYYPRNKGF